MCSHTATFRCAASELKADDSIWIPRDTGDASPTSSRLPVAPIWVDSAIVLADNMLGPVDYSLREDIDNTVDGRMVHCIFFLDSVAARCDKVGEI